MKKKILHVVYQLDSGGIESMLYNYYNNMDRDNIQFDFIVFGEKIGYLEKEFIKLGSKIYHVQHKKHGLIKCIRQVYKIIKENNNENTIIHVHRGLDSGIFLAIAWMHKYKVRIAHSHNYQDEMIGKEYIRYKILSKFTKLFATNYFACGIDAGKWLYGKKAYDNKKIEIIYNAIDTRKYKFNNELRHKKRRELGLENKFVIGNVARFTNQKNHEFLIDIFYEICKNDEDSVLILIGNGENEKKIQLKTEILGIKERVIFLGVRKDVNELLQAMDLFILPSKYEGLPVVLVEAQMSELPCIVSKNITKEVKIIDRISYLSLQDNIDDWCKEILKYKQYMSDNRLNNNIQDYKYDIQRAAKLLELKYINLLE